MEVFDDIRKGQVSGFLTLVGFRAGFLGHKARSGTVMACIYIICV